MTGHDSRHTNHLSHETSPYLQLHAHNPVDWYPWGEEAFRKARAEDKPIFLSVGYSTCYWCHVMERESFSDEAVAALLNDAFVCIKVDREERPDVDDLYMNAVQLMTGSGGWPMSVWLTPDLKPFFSGTYFPPEDRGGQTGLKTLTAKLATAWKDDRKEVERVADEVAEQMRQTSALTEFKAAKAGKDPVAQAITRILSTQDPAFGGRRGAPKFPQDMTDQLLLDQYRRTHDGKLLTAVTRSLDEMAMGGIHDHLGGGFHRYSTDATWTVPHFEKMLYNQAALVRLYADAWEVTRRDWSRRIALETAEFVEREMTDPDTGAFYSALDAETNAEEGQFYLWTAAEIDRTLGPDAPLFAEVYGVAAGPNFEHSRSVLRLRRLPAEEAKARSISEAQLDSRLDPLRQRLLAARGQRPRPATDDKELASWNGLMIGALAHAGQALSQPALIQRASRAADYLLQTLWRKDGRLLRVVRHKHAKQDGFLEDYAFLADSLLDLHEVTGEARWLDSARQIAKAMTDNFADPDGAGFYLSRADTAHLLVRSKSPYDNPIPSGNSVAARALLRLARTDGDEALRRRGEAAVEAFLPVAQRVPDGFAELLRVAATYLQAGAESALAATDSARHVHLEAKLVGPDALVATLKTDPDWHINAHQLATADLIPTTVTVDLPAGYQVLDTQYPQPSRLQTSFAGGLDVYTGEVIVRIRLSVPASRAAGAMARVKATVQACSDRACLQPTTLETAVALGAGR
ncbi:MAG: DUF255 domain-containing protein [Armatimonadetes bacterium]|nr:DUF255 domain-containing protein [Armatimonadota bacterium]